MELLKAVEIQIILSVPQMLDIELALGFAIFLCWVSVLL